MTDPSQAEAPSMNDLAAAQHDPVKLDQAAQQLHQELQTHGTTPPGAAAAPPGAAAGLLGKLISGLGLDASDIDALKGLGVSGLKLLLKIALAKGGLSL